MALKAPMKDMIIILPGILGSILRKDGKDLWAVSGQAIGPIFTNPNAALDRLTLGQDDPEAESLGDGVEATAIMPDVHLVPGLWKIDGYTKTARLVTDNFAVIPGDIYHDPVDKPANFYTFPYDWRRDNRASARILQRLVGQRLSCWRQYSGAQDARVIFMAHSMGGLVARYYLEVLEGWQTSRALFTFGTPYRGSLNAVNFLANGYKKLFLNLTEVMRSFTSVYQLLPIYQAININGEYYRVAEASGLPHIDPLRAQDALAFHREIEAAVTRHLTQEAYRTGFTTLPIAGVHQPTLQSASLVKGQLTASEDLPAVLQGRADLGDGDGTVPKVSAIPLERSGQLDNFFIAEQHGGLQNQPQVLDNLLNVLRIGQFNLEAVRGEAPATAIGLSLEDLYLTTEPVRLWVRLIGLAMGEPLTATVESVTGDRPALHFTLTNQGQGGELAIADLPTGLYRVTVQMQNPRPPAPTPVHGVFEVVRG